MKERGNSILNSISILSSYLYFDYRSSNNIFNSYNLSTKNFFFIFFNSSTDDVVIILFAVFFHPGMASTRRNSVPEIKYKNEEDIQ